MTGKARRNTFSRQHPIRIEMSVYVGLTTRQLFELYRILLTPVANLNNGFINWASRTNETVALATDHWNDKFILANLKWMIDFTGRFQMNLSCIYCENNVIQLFNLSISVLFEIDTVQTGIYQQRNIQFFHRHWWKIHVKFPKHYGGRMKNVHPLQQTYGFEKKCTQIQLWNGKMFKK